LAREGPRLEAFSEQVGRQQPDVHCVEKGREGLGHMKSDSMRAVGLDPNWLARNGQGITRTIRNGIVKDRGKGKDDILRGKGMPVVPDYVAAELEGPDAPFVARHPAGGQCGLGACCFGVDPHQPFKDRCQRLSRRIVGNQNRIERFGIAEERIGESGGGTARRGCLGGRPVASDKKEKAEDTGSKDAGAHHGPAGRSLISRVPGGFAI